MDTVKRVQVYARVSTQKQSELGQGIEVQLKLCREYCQREKIEIVREFVDRGISAAIMGRPALAEMLGDLAEVDAVVVASTNRLWRSLFPQAMIQKTLKEAGRDVIAADQPVLRPVAVSWLFSVAAICRKSPRIGGG